MPNRLNKIEVDGSEYELEDIERDTFQRIGSTVCYDTNSSGTKGVWTVTIPNITALFEGLTIKVRLRLQYDSTNTLNLNGLGAKTVYYQYGSKLTSHYPINSILALTYTTDATSSGTDRSGWIVEKVYYSTDNYTLRDYYLQYYPVETLYRYQVCFINKDSKLVPANSISNSTATNKTLTTQSFDINKDIYYYNSTTTVATTGVTAAATLYRQVLADLKYSFNTGTTLVKYKPVYLVVVPQDDGQVKLSSNPIKQDLPTADTDEIYVFLGVAYDSSRINLNIHHPKYTRVGGKIVSWPLIKHINYAAPSAIINSYALLPLFGGSCTLNNGDLLTLSYSTEDRIIGDIEITNSESIAISLNNGADKAWIELVNVDDNSIIAHSYHGVIYDMGKIKNSKFQRIRVYKYADYSDITGMADPYVIRDRLSPSVCSITLDKSNNLYWLVDLRG